MGDEIVGTQAGPPCDESWHLWLAIVLLLLAWAAAPIVAAVSS